MPKSRILTPSVSTIMFAGLMSRWTMPVVRVVKAGAQLFDDPQLGSQRRLRLGDDDGQSAALDILHGNERLAVVFADVEHGHDVLMGESGQWTGLRAQIDRGARYPRTPLASA